MLKDADIFRLNLNMHDFTIENGRVSLIAVVSHGISLEF